MNDPAHVLSLLAARMGTPPPLPWATALAGRLIRYGTRSGLDSSEDVADLLALWLSVEPQAPGSPYVHGLVRVVLSNQRWPVAVRIAFLRRHLTGRRVTRLDDDEAPRLFGAPAEEPAS